MKKDILTSIELGLCKLLILSTSILWYPLSLSVDVKAHHVVLIAIAFLSLMSGRLLTYLVAEAFKAPLLIFGLLGWLTALTCTVVFFDTTWDLIKVLSFSVQIVIGNYAVFKLLQLGELGDIRRLLNISFIIFIFSFFALSGNSLQDFVNLIVGIVTTGNGREMLNFFARAPLFQSISADGLDGLRHTISMYLSLIFLLNIVSPSKKSSGLLVSMLLILIVFFQSRSAWVALIIPLLVFGVMKIDIKLTIAKWVWLIFSALTGLGLFVYYLMPILFNRAMEVGSYGGRLERLDESIYYLGDLSFLPISGTREFGSSHMFIFDSYYSGGLVAFVFSIFIVISVICVCLPPRKIRFSATSLSFTLAYLFIVRLFTAGSGLPGIGASLGYSIALNVRPKGDSLQDEK